MRWASEIFGQSQYDQAIIAAVQSLGGEGIQATEVYHLSVDQYHRMIAPGILHDGDPVELLDGMLLCKWESRTIGVRGSSYITFLSNSTRKWVASAF